MYFVITILTQMNKTTRNFIIERAAVLFKEKGYKGTSMRDLAKEVGMEAASLYNHIKSKQEILSEQLLGTANRFVDGMSDVERADTRPIEKIEALISLHIKITVANPDTISLVTHEWRHLEGNALLEFTAKKKDYERRFKNILVQGIFEGEIKNINADIALFSILSTMRWFYAWYSKRNELSIKELETQFFDILIGGLRK